MSNFQRFSLVSIFAGVLNSPINLVRRN